MDTPLPLTRLQELEQSLSHVKRDFSALLRQAQIRDRLYKAYITTLMRKLGYTDDVIESELTTLTKDTYLTPQTDHDTNLDTNRNIQNGTDSHPSS